LLHLPKRRQRAIFLGYELNFLLSLTFSEQLAARLLRAIKKTLGSACCLLAVRSYPLYYRYLNSMTQERAQHVAS
jgi:hypothetical protein